VEVGKRGVLQIPPGAFALVVSDEYFEMPLDVAGQVGLKSEYARRGIVVLAGPQIDPGFKGTLHLGLANLSTQPVTFVHKGDFATVVFYKLSQPVERGYEGEFQAQEGLSAQELQELAGGSGMTFGQVVTTLGTLATDVAQLTSSLQEMRKDVSSAASQIRWALVIAGFVLTSFLGGMTWYASAVVDLARDTLNRAAETRAP
jgi:dUTPase